MLVSVAIDLALDRTFTYLVPAELTEKLKLGQLLRVPFGHRIARGFAVAVSSDETSSAAGGRPLKAVLAIEDPVPFFSPELLKLVKWIAAYTGAPLETALKAAVPAAVLRPGAKPKEQLFVEVKEGEICSGLTARQRELLENIRRVGGGWAAMLAREFKTSPATLKALADKGVLAIERRQSRRDPLAGRLPMRTKPMAPCPEQAAALAAIRDAARPVLLHGVTGSGKTEVYLQAIAAELDAGRGAIVLVPEISLTPQTVRRFAARFGTLVAVLHSALSGGERFDEWHRIRSGEARVVVGPRSAVFAPVASLGLIVVDEEHDGSYKQDEAPRYHARDIAVVRAALEGAKVVLGSATPSLESWRNARDGKYTLVSMANRVMGRPMPEIRVVNMEEEKMRLGAAPIFSGVLLDAIRSRLARGEQTILFLNRRGFSRALECPECGYVEECPECSVAYTYHRVDDCLRCHVCGGWKRPEPKCPKCGFPDLRRQGVGTQRVEEALSKCFPKARIIRMDADSVARRHSHDELLSKFRAQEADILVGTQMIAKGLDFPNVTLVGVLNADSSLHIPDPRAAERTYQLLAQVAGRAGRAELPGEVFLQAFDPVAPAIAAVADGRGYAAFADEELRSREAAGMPPYLRLSTLTFRSKDEHLAAAWCELWAKSLSKWPGLDVSAPMPAFLAKAEGWFRYQLTLRSKAAATAVKAWRWIAEQRPVPGEVRVALDVDALDLV